MSFFRGFLCHDCTALHGAEQRSGLTRSSSGLRPDADAGRSAPRGCGCEVPPGGVDADARCEAPEPPGGPHRIFFPCAGKHEKSRFLVIFTTFSSDFQRWSQNGYLERCPTEARLRFPHRECTQYSALCLESVGKASRTQDLGLRRRSRSFAQRSFARGALCCTIYI